MSSTRCEIRSGFFILRDCGRTAIGQCGECGRSYCDKHEVKMAQGGDICSTCAEKRGLIEDENDFGRHRDRDQKSPWHLRGDRQRDRDRDRDDDAVAAAFTANEMAQFEASDRAGEAPELENENGLGADGFAGESEDISIFDS